MGSANNSGKVVASVRSSSVATKVNPMASPNSQNECPPEGSICPSCGKGTVHYGRFSRRRVCTHSQCVVNSYSIYHC